MSGGERGGTREATARVARSSARRVGRLIRDGERLVNLDRLIVFVGYRYATALLVLVALLALYGVAQFSRPSRADLRQPGTRAAVTSAVLACPAPAGTRLSALTSGLPGRRGHLRITAPDGGERAQGPTATVTAWSQDIDDRASSGRRGNRDTAEPYAVRASGAVAGGLEVEQTGMVKKGADRGLAGVRCTGPGTDMWFLGPGPVDAHDIELHLSNVDDQPAAVDVLALSGEGPLDTTDGRGTTVEPHSGRVVGIGRSAEGLGDIVKTARVLALHVRVTTGRASAAVRVRVGDKKGVDWMPLASPPTREVVVPGLPAGGGPRQLLVGVPGGADAQVKIQVITPSGMFAPEGQDRIDAPAQTVTPVDLERALSGKPAAVRLSSDRPIIAGFIATVGADVAYGAATAPLGGGGVVADNREGTVVLLTAPTGAATVRLVTVTGQGPAGSPREVTVAAGRTLEVKVPAPQGGDRGFGILITPRPGSPAVYGARVLTSGKGDKRLCTVLPVMPAPTSVAQPPVAESLTSLIP
ncbi:MAG TPA: DUF5719 family protein [Actinomadura sp.]|jgi:hypothetical protein|nr:DUF5719 family protein [Actinomadura sp.]